jgi:hypothetical protein
MRKRSSGGCGSFLFLLFFVFLALKVSGAIDWSWWWVTSPIWLPGALALAGMALLAVTGASVYKIVAGVLRRQNSRRGGSPRADFLEADGSEVPVPSSGGQRPLALSTSTRPSDDAGGPAAPAAADADRPSG